MPPHAWKQLEVALSVARAIRVVPKVEGHGRHRLGHNQLTNLVQNWASSLVKGFNGRAQTPALDFPGADGQ